MTDSTTPAPHSLVWLRWMVAALLVATSIGFALSARSEQRRATAEIATNATATSSPPVGVTETTPSTTTSPLDAGAASGIIPATITPATSGPATTLSAKEARESPAQRAREHPTTTTAIATSSTTLTSPPAGAGPATSSSPSTTAAGPTLADPDGGNETPTATHPTEATILGINPEATWSVVAGTLLGLALALAVVASQSLAPLAAAAIVTAAFAALDLHERTHQQLEHADNLATAAGTLAAAHALTALLAAITVGVGVRHRRRATT